MVTAALLDRRADEPVHVAVDRGAGGNGPKEFHLVLLDNGRTNVLADEVGRQALNCIRCSACLNVCPVYERTGGQPTSRSIPGRSARSSHRSSPGSGNADLPWARQQEPRRTARGDLGHPAAVALRGGGDVAASPGRSGRRAAARPRAAVRAPRRWRAAGGCASDRVVDLALGRLEPGEQAAGDVVQACRYRPSLEPKYW